MGYALEYLPQAHKEWLALDASVREPLKKKLLARLQSPHVPAARLSGPLNNCYKIKNDKTGHRLVYQVLDSEVVVLVVAIGQRAEAKAYRAAAERLD